ncbi:lysine-sensitive aspartokinase 3 [Candidatus Acetothermia bacterium]|jgi:aspartate kinase|nr:lysine-sensitive aspartokinase 3 [Candidatus Acetothermia bacterium]MCI2436812.1 lysine-sensitive aspartokinase 3 [Candidatus Acetothermia bacterium]
MIVMKFGGTSVEDAAAMRQVIEIVRSKRARQPIVVASAMAKITDTLIRSAQLAREGQEHQAQKLLTEVVALRHRQAATQLVVSEPRCRALQESLDQYIVELRTFIHGLAILGELSPRSLDAIVSYGERLSTLILTTAMQEQNLDAQLLDARQFIITDDRFTKATPSLELSDPRARSLVLPLLERDAIPVTQGFIGATPQGVTTTLGRGGSDYSAAIIGALLGAEAIEIWTDVDGILTTDPKLVPQARLLESVTFQEASELAYFGAKVLHPSTLLPAVDKNIPVYVYNTKNPKSPGTRITMRESPTPGALKAIAYKKGITVINIYSTRMLLAHGFLKAIFEIFDRFETSVDLLATSEVSVSLTIDETRRLDRIVSELQKFSTVTVEHERAIICLVGEGMKYTPGIAARAFGAIRDININMISQGASEINISFIIREADVPTVLERLHREFFEP